MTKDVCGVRKELDGYDGMTHSCGRKAWHKGKHGCAYCDHRWAYHPQPDGKTTVKFSMGGDVVEQIDIHGMNALAADPDPFIDAMVGSIRRAVESWNREDDDE